jgi:UDP-glucose 4-epimerase
MRILVTGGAGYIGSIAVEMLRREGFEVSILDDCSTGHADVVPFGVRFIQGSLLSPAEIREALAGCDAVMHFAGKSLVGESVANPDLYWSVNVGGTRNLLDEMAAASISKIVFSSSAATYGEPSILPILETSPTYPTNPYGATKLAIDEMISLAAQKSGLAGTSLRYFNVAGALESDRGWLAERHSPETHLIPIVLRSSDANPVKIFGTDWPTADGTCIRDYVHVVDLIDAHIKALKSIEPGQHQIFNLGNGKGYSVREVINAASAALGARVPSIDSSRRAGDPAVLIADISKAKVELNWRPTRDIKAMVTDTLASFA